MVLLNTNLNEHCVTENIYYFNLHTKNVKKIQFIISKEKIKI